MPGSGIASVASAGSIGSRYSKRYRTKSKNSSVEESLFGNNKAKPPKHQSNSAPPTPNGASLPSTQKSKKKKPETIQLISKDLIRRCRIPDQDPSGLTVVLRRNKFMQLKESSRVRTHAEIQKEIDDQMKFKIQNMEESEKRKDEMRELERNRRANTKLNDLEVEAKEKAEYLLTKANAERLEQDEEIKGVNTWILNAKCHAIRDAQLLEKQQMKNEIEQESLRLDTMMELDRINAIKAAEDIDEMRQKQRYLGAQQLLKQIESNAQERVLNEERRDQETKMVLKKLDQLHEQDMKELQEKKRKQLALAKEIRITSEEQLRYREREIELDREMEFKVLQYQKLRDEREAARELERKQLKKQKEMEIARIRGLQEKAIDAQANRDALVARRNQEENERMWRKKEKLEALKKAESEAIMRKARAEQVQNKEHYIAVQAQRERHEFERVLAEQKKQIAQDLEREKALHAARRRNGDFVRQQIRDKEQLAIEARKKHFEEGIRMEEEARQRRVRLTEVKNKKLIELREAGIPMKYCNEIERKIHHPNTTLQAST